MKVIDGQNISLVDALSRCGFQSTGNSGEFECDCDGKKFVLTNLTGIVKEIPNDLEDDENIEGGNDTSNLKNVRQASEEGHKDRNGDTILHDGTPIKQHSIDEEQGRSTEALEQNGFHVVSEGGYQSSGGNQKKESGKSIIVPNERGTGLKLEKEQENNKKGSKKS